MQQQIENHVLESLPYIGSTASVMLMRDQIVKKTIPLEVAYDWMSAISFSPRPDADMMQAMYTLVEYGNTNNELEFTLGATAVAHTFCRQNPDCAENKHIKKITKFLMGEVLTNVRNNTNSRQMKNKVMVSLKGLGNIGSVNKQLVEALQSIITDESILLEIRLQAILVFRKTDCFKTRDFFLGMYRNFTEQTEIRIMSYLQAIRCPDYISIKLIKHVLQTEEVNQVGSYVWSHLTNLAKSSSPVRVETQGLLIDGELNEKYKLDIRRFSRNYEYSLFFDEYNFGTTTDANLIFGTDSFMPRMATLNFTVDLFGESINLYEFSARMQGFEHYVESLFGPKGPFSGKKVEEKFNDVIQPLKNLLADSDEDLTGGESGGERNDDDFGLDDDDFDYNGRTKRDTDISRSPRVLQADLRKGVGKLGYKLKNIYNHPTLEFGMKMFGNDLKYQTVDDYKEMKQFFDKMNPKNHLIDLLSGREIKYTKSGIFLDVSYAVPLSSGIPLSVSALGASSIDLRMSGLLKTGDQNNHFDVEGKIKPSVSVDIIATMKSDLFYADSGIKVKTNMYSSSTVEAKLKVRSTKLVSLQLSLPQDKNEIFSAKSEILVQQVSGEISQPGIATRYENSTCTWPVIDIAVGLKICTDYSLPDLSNKQVTYPSLILTGPFNLNVYLTKADPTAKIFSFEYRWDENKEGTKASFVFETPKSAIPRIFSANFNRINEDFNISTSFKNGNQIHAAEAVYKVGKNEKRLDCSLNIDGQKQLALEMGYNRTELKYGWTYFPRVILSVNSDRIAGLAGTIKFNKKKNISQIDLNVIFETKKLQSKMEGYVTITEASWSTKLSTNYRFLETKAETIEIEAELANRSQKLRSEYTGLLKIKSSAYPKFNFVSDGKFLNGMGHAEGLINFNNAVDFKDPLYNLAIKCMLAKSQIDSETRTTTSLEITRPISKIDFKLVLRLDDKLKKGPEHNFYGLLKYATGKEVTTSLSVWFPFGPLYAIDTTFNLTVPAFDSCSARLKIYEKQRNDYDVYFNGSWFSGHSIIVKGLYHDRSSVIKTYRNFKLVVQSPSFDETSVDIRYSNDAQEFKFKTMVIYAEQPYAMTLKYSEFAANEKVSYVELRWQEKSYWVKANLTSLQTKQLLVDMHFDKLRDIHIVLGGFSTELKKELRIEVKWDANRDPSQKLIVSADLNTPGQRTYDGGFLVSYPDRSFNGRFDIFALGPQYKANTRLSWSSSEAVEVKFESGSNAGEAKDLWFNALFITPFDGWKYNSMTGGFFYINNLLLLNSSITWAETQHLGLEVMGDYENKDPAFSCEIKTALNSTIKDVPTLSAHLKHNHDHKKFETDFMLKHKADNETQQMFAVRSNWHLEFSDSHRNISGSIALRSPFEGYTRGALVTKFSLNTNRQLMGAADLDLEEKRFKLAVEGHIKKLTDNMLVVNITTPIEKFRNVIGRFGINEYEKHVVAEVRAPNASLGFEVLFSILSTSEFNIKFLLATPLDAFEKLLLIAKMNGDTIDFRGGWNKVALGFVGVWRMETLTDFEYSYRIFTPLENFEENGLVARLIKRNNIDVEVSLKLAKYKLGLIVVGQPKSQLLQQLRLQRTSDLLKEFGEIDTNDDEEDQDEDEEEKDVINFSGHMELDTLIWPTIKGFLEVEEFEDFYLAYATIVLPQGNVEIRDKLIFPDYLTIINKLRIVTPFTVASEINSNYESIIDMGNQYQVGMEVSFLNNTRWVESGVHVKYTKQTDDADLKTHNVIVKLKTPLTELPKIRLQAIVELDENLYRGKFMAKTGTTDLSLGGSLETESNYIDSSLNIRLVSVIVPFYSCRAFFKKDFSNVDNSFDVGYELSDNITSNNLQLQTTWSQDRSHFLQAKVTVNTNIIPLTTVEGAILLTRTPNPLASLEITYKDNEGNSDEIRAKASRTREMFNVEVNLPLPDFRNLSLFGTLSETSKKNTYAIMGNLYSNQQIYHLEGTSVIVADIPAEINVTFKPSTGGESGTLTYSVQDTEGGYGKTFQAKLARSGKFAQIGGGLAVKSKLNWDFAFAFSSSEPEIGNINITSSLSPELDDKVIGSVEINTPWTKYEIDRIRIGTEIKILPSSGAMIANYHLPKIQGSVGSVWSWQISENMQISLESKTQKSGAEQKLMKAALRYLNPNKSMQRLTVGGDLNIDALWILSGNGSIMLASTNDIGASASLLLPQPVGDTHRLSGRYRGNLGGPNPNVDLNYEISYESDEMRRRYASRGQFRNVTDVQGLLRIEWGPDIRTEALEGNIQMLRKGTKKEFSARVSTPYYLEDTVAASGSYDTKDIYHVFKGILNVPTSNKVAEGDVAFSSLSNMKGNVNCSTPFLDVSWLKGDFDFSTHGGDTIRYVKATWPNNSAIFDSKSEFTSQGLNRDQQGVIKIEVPLQTRHIASIVYGLKERPQIITGHTAVEYNKKNILNGQYTCKSETKAGFDKDVVDITLENEYKPIGIHFVHQYQHSGGPFESNFDFKRAEVFELRKSAQYNITGELHIRTTDTGQEYKIIAIHPNRTVIWSSDYDYKDVTTTQRSKLELSPTVWLGYNFQLQNLTSPTNESQVFSIELTYPKRNLSTEGWYSVTEKSFDSDISFKWTHTEESDFDSSDEQKEPEQKVMRAALKWTDDSSDGLHTANQKTLISLRHPSFEKDITLQGNYHRNPLELFSTKVLVEYAEDPMHLLTFGATLKDLSSLMGHRNYTLGFFGNHEASELELEAAGSVSVKPGLYEGWSSGKYKRGYLPLQEGSVFSFLNLHDKEVFYNRTTPYKVYRFWYKADGVYPVYTVNGSYEDSPDIDSVGAFYIDIEDKTIKLQINLTEDASQNIYMYGVVPDARSASFDLWRDYEDIRVVDIAYYLRMNHSRLVTSHLLWRPNLKNELKDQVRNVATGIYTTISDTIDYWIKTVYTESVDTVNDVWHQARPYSEKFLDDVGGLKVIGEDVEELRKFLNESYHADDFYIRSVVNFTLTVLDELAVKNHITSLPKIIREIGQVMGESGQALRKSVLWLIETIKQSYKKALDILGQILHGEALEHMTGIMEKAVEKYDKFIKDLHVSFIKYVENMYTTAKQMISSYWQRMLMNIEPSLLKLLHYVEMLGWNIGKEVFDFLYKRTNEIIESPYFNQVSNFTQDLDRLYKDLIKNDTITNIKKYSVLAWQFLKEKYFKIVPFGDELNSLVTELWGEIKKLQNIESVQFVIQRYQEVQAKVEWLADEFQVERRIAELWQVIRNKLSRYAQTALQADNKYREAKTKFIFDPDRGVMELQQKLPMSWHAFNETPKFEEIPEYKMLTDVQNFFSGTNFSLWNWYKKIIPYQNPNKWLPPYEAHSILIGSRHYMTFDKRFVSLNLKYHLIEANRKPDQCSFLLSHDFLDGNFTLILEPSIIRKNDDLISTRKLSLFADNELIDIDYVANVIRIGRNATTALPAQIGNTTIYRVADILYLASDNGFLLECNLLFDVCTFDLSGWYFGKTAGILGTMNNEAFDDYTTSNNQFAQTHDQFINSWSLPLPECQKEVTETNFAELQRNVDLKVANLCGTYFGSTLSIFESCFVAVDPQPFYNMCLDLGSNQVSSFLPDGHPAEMGACTVAIAYMQACALESIALRVPETCVHCDLQNGSYVPEGTFLELKGSDIPKSTDVVFIIEAKQCNEDVINSKSLMTLVSALNKELIEQKIVNNRYAVMAFGGPAPFDKPRNIIVNNKIFTEFNDLAAYFKHIKTGLGNSNDIFEAIITASKMIFRSGASKTFILLPCSKCSSFDMKFDYSAMMQLMLEDGIKLHILMDHPFTFDKDRLSKMFYGMDRRYAYSKKDLGELTRDTELRKQVRLPKPFLGVCSSVAIETNGTIFTARKLMPDKKNPIKKFSSVFAKRVATSAHPIDCQTCECSGHDTGIAYMHCYQCDRYPSPMSIEEGFDEDTMASKIQGGENFDDEDED